MNHNKILIGLIGAGIQQSLSPGMHEAEASRQGLKLHYQLIDIDRNSASPSDLPLLIRAAKLIGFAGLNITYPCKQAVIPLLDELSDEARAVNAVNTVVIRDGRMIGHNTDGTGWAWGFRRQLPDADLGRVVLLGAGGAGAAVADAVLRLGAGHLSIVDQDGKRAEALASRMGELHGELKVSADTDIGRALAGATGLIHATPVGMDKLPGLPLPADLLRPDMWVSEVVYFPLETALLKAARAIGCAVADGGGMAVGQAVGAFRLFTGLEPDVASMDAHLRSMVRSRSGS